MASNSERQSSFTWTPDDCERRARRSGAVAGRRVRRWRRHHGLRKLGKSAVNVNEVHARRRRLNSASHAVRFSGQPRNPFCTKGADAVRQPHATTTHVMLEQLLTQGGVLREDLLRVSSRPPPAAQRPHTAPPSK